MASGFLNFTEHGLTPDERGINSYEASNWSKEELAHEIEM